MGHDSMGSGGHVIIYHLLTEGKGFAGLEHGKPVPLTAGDIVIFPHGDSHVIGNGAHVEPVDQERELHPIFAQGLKLARAGGGGEVTKLVCGYMSCDPEWSRVFLAGPPAILKVNVRDGAAGQWLEIALLHRRPAQPWTIASPGQSPIWRETSDYHVPFWPSASDTI
jgi:hypothetical protein